MESTRPTVTMLPLTSTNEAALFHWRNWLSDFTSDQILEIATQQIAWRKDSIKMFGKTIQIPRLQNWFSESGQSYTYSRLSLPGLEYPEWMNNLSQDVKKTTQNDFNGILVNYYRNGSDSMGWHADDENSLGSKPAVASVSLGAERNFQLRHKGTKDRVNIPLSHGSLLLMCPGIQEYWQHRIAKTKDFLKPRISLTFRKLVN
ncbi:MAG: alpha-ketoglutarate-dependent dioxygenase AlkB [Cellvibrionales bacterium TMED148]|nr:alpha-ketoglutarate-dependent dioxygenase AlkB [Porticoccaceae bacterium]RPG92405.1 MAG: alpha-ketoglutarate-dependent dioxygenase AlkB [Cellvibrionales bacterium TMED148]